jgi:NCS1 family nucleobase:cation symporter-1
MDIAGLFPSYINIRRGAYIGLIISIALCPWQLLSSAATFISVLSAYSVFLGPMAGIMICDYWVVRRGRVKLSDLYHGREEGVYYFWNGINWRSFTAWIVGWSYLLPGFVKAVAPGVDVPAACTNLYYLAFPLGFAVSFVVYWGLNRVWPPRGLGDVDEVDEFGTFTASEGAKLGAAAVSVLHGRMGVVEDELVVADDKNSVRCK